LKLQNFSHPTFPLSLTLRPHASKICVKFFCLIVDRHFPRTGAAATGNTLPVLTPFVTEAGALEVAQRPGARKESHLTIVGTTRADRGFAVAARPSIRSSNSSAAARPI
jgi:hypothetical protein